ncbi:MAG: hypothetical protein K8F52_15100 [Candidatus Scalindua rubra]|nr:hypothetical protein [Candidatus Scalindua rubra]
MSQKMLFNHNSYKNDGLVPRKSGLLLDILCCQTDDYIIEIKHKIEKFSKYKKPGTKTALTPVQYVYRTLTNVEVFKSIISQLTKTETNFLAFLCDQKEEVSWKEVKSAGFTKKVVLELRLFGLVFVFPDRENPEYIILPAEYRYLLFSNNREEESVLYALRTLGVEKVKQTTDYLNERFNGNFDPSLSKASNVAFLYNFLMTRGKEIEKVLTVKQKEIILFVLQHGNKIELEILLDRFTTFDIHAGEASINTVFKKIFHRFQARQHGKKYTELQELFHMGVLVFTNPEYSNNVFIPKEIFPVLAREYLAKTEAKKKKIMAQMLSDGPGHMKCKSIDSLLYMLTKNIIVFLVFSYTRPTQKGLVPKTAIKKCAKILRVDHIEQVDCLLIFLLLKDYVTSKGKRCFVPTQKGEKFLYGNLSSMDFWKEIENFFLISIDWNELYKSPNRVLDYHTIPLNCDFKRLLYRRMRDIPHRWLKAAKFREMLYEDYDFTKILNVYDSLEHIQDGHYPAMLKSEFND